MSDSRCETFSQNNELSHRMQSTTRPLRVITQYSNVESSMQSPGRPTSLGFCVDNSQLKDSSQNNFTQDYASQPWNIKSEDTNDLDKILGQLNNNGSTPVTPTSFLNPNNITEDQERFADNFSRTLNKVKAEQEGLANIHPVTSSAESLTIPLVSQRTLCCDDQVQQQSPVVLDASLSDPRSSEELTIPHFMSGSTSDQPSPTGLHQGPSVPNPSFSAITSAFLTGDPLVLCSTSSNTRTTTTPSSTISSRNSIDLNTSVGLQDAIAVDITGELNDNGCTIDLENLRENTYGEVIVARPPASTPSSESQWAVGLPTILSITASLKGGTTTCPDTDASLSDPQSTYSDTIGHSNFSDLLFSGCRVVQTQSMLPDEGQQQPCFTPNDRHDNRLSNNTAFLVAATSTAVDSPTALHNSTGTPPDNRLHYPISHSTGDGGSHYHRYQCIPNATIDSMGSTAITTVCSPFSNINSGTMSLDPDNSSAGQQNQPILAAPITVLFARSPSLISAQTDTGNQKMITSTCPLRCSSSTSAPADVCPGSLLGADPLRHQQHHHHQQQQHLCHQVYSESGGCIMAPAQTSTVSALPMTATLATGNGSAPGLGDHCTTALLMQHTNSTGINNTGGPRFIPPPNPSSQSGMLAAPFQSLASGGGMLMTNGFMDGQLSEFLVPLVQPTVSLQHRTTDANPVLTTSSGNNVNSIMMGDRVGLSGSQQRIIASPMTTQSLTPPSKRNRRVSGTPVNNRHRLRAATPFQIDETYQMFDSQLSSSGNMVGDLATQSYYAPTRRMINSNQTALELSASDTKSITDNSKASDDGAEECHGLQLTTPPSSLDGSGEKDGLKLERKRARNRVAARRCRERKISLIRSLENQVAERDAHVRNLEAALTRYRVEGERLREHIEQLASNYPNLKVELCKYSFLPKSDASG